MANGTPQTAPNLQGWQVLVVDDQAMAREVLAEALRPLGAVVRQAASGAEALAELNLKSARLIFIDLMMPDMDGAALARQIRRNEYAQPEQKHLLVAYSGHLYAEKHALVALELTRLAEQGFDNGLAKPVTTEALHRVLHELIGEPRVDEKPEINSSPSPKTPEKAKLDVPAHLMKRGPQLAAAYFVPQVQGLFQKALVVDDDRVSLMAAEVQVGQLVARVDTASSAEAAVKAFMAAPYDLILLDLEMPDEDGFALASRLRGLEEGSLHRTCLVALSGHLANLSTLQACAKHGMDDCLAKPLDMALMKTRMVLWQTGVFPTAKLRG
jgi:two-component system, sensor histidine kinase and response regulator